MPTLQLTNEQEGLLTNFVNEAAYDQSASPDDLAELLSKVMRTINVRKLESVDPESARLLLQAVFEILKARHLRENGFLSKEQFLGKVADARESVSSIPY